MAVLNALHNDVGVVGNDQDRLNFLYTAIEAINYRRINTKNPAEESTSMDTGWVMEVKELQ